MSKRRIHANLRLGEGTIYKRQNGNLNCPQQLQHRQSLALLPLDLQRDWAKHRVSLIVVELPRCRNIDVKWDVNEIVGKGQYALYGDLR